ncbi:MAG: hypothetical protein FWF29_09930 [Treponema sp.]|nr:hypothetical protein [Treponema sp.]
MQSDVQSLLHHTDPSVNIVKVEEVYYPYKRISYELEVGKQVNKKFMKKADCIIDLVQGSVAEGEGTPEYEELSVNPEQMLEVCVQNEDAVRKGHDFVLKLFLNKAKVLRVPRITVTSEELFYKNFFIVHCKDREALDYFLLMDSMDGGLSILNYQ